MLRKILISFVVAMIGFAGFDMGAFANDVKKPIDLMATMGSPKGNEIPSYLVGLYTTIPDAVSKLKKSGYTIVSKYNVLNVGTTILFTDDALMAQASKKNRGFMAVLRLFVDSKYNEIRITNPIYFGKAFMQDDYNQNVFFREFKTLFTTFDGLKASKDRLKFKELGGYHFMFGMPYYDDFDVVGKGSISSLFTRGKAYRSGKKLLFSLKISEGTYLFGYKLNAKIASFPKKIGLKNALVLPYLVLLSNGKARILNAKYYLAISYPLLSLGQFMKISSIPGDIESYFESIFKK